ncbi:hypothetical protein [Acinetobacter baumannii]|uniref:hypothetical protein n=1 Tax=Acinetobacter baumannii TaxID=470 RepID=UPI0028769DA5|nr:hypothetical protein [Acinetobacter baumannii]MDS1318210.1 hypothetical protein [Acinetobacter baumannii]
MSHKIIKPDLDLVLARFAIFGVLTILFVASSVNGHPSWLTWIVMLWGVFSIFEAAIKADEALENVIDSQTMIDDLAKRVIIQHRIIKYQDQRFDQLVEFRGEEIKGLKASHHGEVIGHEVHLKQVKKNRDELRVRVDSLEQALNKVSDWNAHPEGYEANFGAWGVRDFYRSLAKQALAKKE